MEIFFNNFLELIGFNLPGFSNGAQAALAGVLAFIIILKLIGFIFFRRSLKKCSGIFVESEKGRFYISKQAIADLVKTKEVEVPGLNIFKIYLYKKRKNYIVKVTAELNDKEGAFPELVVSLQNKILASLNDNLGVQSIKFVDIELKRVNSN